MAYQIQVTGVKETMDKVLKFNQMIKGEVTYEMLGVGELLVEKLQIKYPDLLITQQFFPNNMEFWIGISRTGKSVTWIKCPVSNLFFKKTKESDGSQQISSDVQELDVEAIVFEISEELNRRLSLIKIG
jgi:hypothetical protein